MYEESIRTRGDPQRTCRQGWCIHIGGQGSCLGYRPWRGALEHISVIPALSLHRPQAVEGARWQAAGTETRQCSTLDSFPSCRSQQAWITFLHSLETWAVQEWDTAVQPTAPSCKEAVRWGVPSLTTCNLPAKAPLRSLEHSKYILHMTPERLAPALLVSEGKSYLLLGSKYSPHCQYHHHPLASQTSHSSFCLSLLPPALPMAVTTSSSSMLFLLSASHHYHHHLLLLPLSCLSPLFSPLSFSVDIHFFFSCNVCTDA